MDKHKIGILQRYIEFQQDFILENENESSLSYQDDINNLEMAKKWLTELQKTKTINMTFGQALELIKQGKAVSRESWQNENIAVTLRKGSHDFSTKDPNSPEGDLISIQGTPISLFEKGDTGTFTRMPSFELINKYGSIVAFTPNADSIIAEDWVEVGNIHALRRLIGDNKPA
jgi:hypothetical protein